MKGCRTSTLINGCNYCLSELQSRRKSLQASLSSMLRRSGSATSSLESTNVPSKPNVMQESTFYMRTLPEHTIAFSSSKGASIFRHAAVLAPAPAASLRTSAPCCSASDDSDVIELQIKVNIHRKFSHFSHLDVTA